MPTNRGPIVALTSLALVGGAVLIVLTPWGLGLSPDSAVYIGSARSLLHGRGLSLPSQSEALAPVIHYAPLYPALLAAIGLGGPDPLEAAKWFSGLVFAANIFVAGGLAFAETRSIWMSLSASLLIMSALPIVQVHSMVWSEALFILFQSCAFVFFRLYFRTPKSGYLLAAAATVGVCVVTRYAGAALLASGAASTLMLSNGNRQKRLLHAATFLAIGSLPIAGWIARNWALTGSPVNRSVSFHPIGLEHLAAIVMTMTSWISASSLLVPAEQIAIGLGGLAMGVLTWMCRREPKAQMAGFARTTISIAFPGLMVAVILAYGLTLFVTISFLDYQTPIDSRILSPLYVPMLLLGILLASRLVGQRGNGNGSSRRVLLAVTILAGLQVASTWPWLALMYKQGVGYASREWQDSIFLQKVSRIPPTTPIFSNAPDVLYTLLGRRSAMVPRKSNPDTRAPNERFESQLEEMKRELRRNDGVVVYFSRVHWRWYLPSQGELQTGLGLRVLVHEPDGSIFRAD